MKKIIAAGMMFFTMNVQATLDPMQECVLYMQIYDIVSEVTGEPVSDENPVHRGILAGVLTLATQLEYEGYVGTDVLMENVRSAITSVTEMNGGGKCEE